jgi:hypothetical protein
MQVQAERPVMTRKASGAIRELSREQKKGMKGKNSQESLRVQNQKKDPMELKYEAFDSNEDDSVVEAMVDDMMIKGRIEVGVALETPVTAPPIEAETAMNEGVKEFVTTQEGDVNRETTAGYLSMPMRSEAAKAQHEAAEDVPFTTAESQGIPVSQVSLIMTLYWFVTDF